MIDKAQQVVNDTFHNCTCEMASLVNPCRLRQTATRDIILGRSSEAV